MGLRAGAGWCTASASCSASASARARCSARPLRAASRLARASLKFCCSFAASALACAQSFSSGRAGGMHARHSGPACSTQRAPTRLGERRGRFLELLFQPALRVARLLPHLPHRAAPAKKPPPPFVLIGYAASLTPY